MHFHGKTGKNTQDSFPNTIEKFPKTTQKRETTWETGKQAGKLRNNETSINITAS
jgi:hypothetical protein